MQTASRTSRHARISGDCPVCQYPLQGLALTKRPCGHLLCSPCYLDGVIRSGEDADFNVDRCEQCREAAFTKTRHGSTLMEHFSSSKALVVAPATSKKDASRVVSRASSWTKRARAGSAGPAGTGGWRNDIHLIHLPKHIPRYLNWKGVMMDSCGG